MVIDSGTKTLRDMRFVVIGGPQRGRHAETEEKEGAVGKRSQDANELRNRKRANEMFVKVLCRYKTFL